MRAAGADHRPGIVRCEDTPGERNVRQIAAPGVNAGVDWPRRAVEAEDLIRAGG
jgi:hypothetical protein